MNYNISTINSQHSCMFTRGLYNVPINSQHSCMFTRGLYNVPINSQHSCMFTHGLYTVPEVALSLNLNKGSIGPCEAAI